MCGATLSLARLPLGPLVPARHFFPPFSPNAEPGPRLLRAYTRVLYRTVSFLCLTRAQREVKYEELTLAEFVAEYAQILLCKDISPLERTEREKHLVSLMHIAQQ